MEQNSSLNGVFLFFFQKKLEPEHDFFGAFRASKQTPEIWNRLIASKLFVFYMGLMPTFLYYDFCHINFELNIIQ